MQKLLLSKISVLGILTKEKSRPPGREKRQFHEFFASLLEPEFAARFFPIRARAASNIGTYNTSHCKIFSGSVSHDFAAIAAFRPDFVISFACPQYVVTRRSPTRSAKSAMSRRRSSRQGAERQERRLKATSENGRR
jgi:hypothetical protein